MDEKFQRIKIAAIFGLLILIATLFVGAELIGKARHEQTEDIANAVKKVVEDEDIDVTVLNKTGGVIYETGSS